jgi:hypothetical protein
MPKANAKSKKAKAAKKSKAAVVAPAVQKPVVEEQKAATLPTPTSKRLSHLKLGYKLAGEGLTDEQAYPMFHESFMGRGCTRGDQWIAQRCATYMKIGRRDIAREKAAIERANSK